MTLWNKLLGRAPKPELVQRSTDLHTYMSLMTGIGMASKEIIISPKSALSIGVVYECVEAITNTFKLISPKVIVENRSGKFPAYSHPVYPLVNMEPHPLYDAGKYYEQLIVHYLLWGNAYAYITRNIAGIPVSLEVIEPHKVTVDIIDVEGIKERWYKIEDRPGVFNQRDIIHIADISHDMVRGYSRILTKASALKGVGAVQNYSNDMYKNGATISGMIYGDRMPGREELEYMRKKFQEQMQRSSGEIGVLPAGFKYEPLKYSMPFADSQVIEATKMSVETVARIMGVPLSLIGRGESADNKADREYNTFLNTTIAPISILIENEHNRKLFRPDERGQFYMKFELKGLYRVDMLARYQAHQIALAHGFMNKDEVRSVEGMNKIPNGLGEIYYQQINTIPLDKVDAYYDSMIENKTTKENQNDFTGD